MRGRLSPRVPPRPAPDRVVQSRPKRRMGKCRRSPRTRLLFSKFSAVFVLKFTRRFLCFESFVLSNLKDTRLHSAVWLIKFNTFGVFFYYLLLLSFFLFGASCRSGVRPSIEAPSLDARTNLKGHSL